MKRNVLILVLLSLVGGLTFVAIAGKRAARPQELVAIPAFKSGVEGVEISSIGVSADGTGAPTLEVRESARTIFVVPAVAKFFNPQPDPPGQQQ